MTETTRTLCSSCVEEGGSEETPFAVAHCSECDENYCEDCSKQHKKFKQTKNHNLEEIIAIGIELKTSLAQKPIQAVEPNTQYRSSTDTKEGGSDNSNKGRTGPAETHEQTDFRTSESSSDVSECEIGWAKSFHFEEANYDEPTYRLVLDLPCQCLKPMNNQSIVHAWWSCIDCNELLEYAFDQYFYCKCGRAKRSNVQFKCNRSDHGEIFHTFDEGYITNIVSKIKRKKEVNILILGETGVGKSTWINSIVNYITYPSVEEAAKQEKLLSLIPTSFEITTDNFDIKKIKIGDDKNEEHKTGQSATQSPKSYLIEQKTRLVRLIDTPGIGDTRGIDTDKTNFDNILKYLANLDTLDGICILLKPNNSRLNILFRFCINELLIHLHKDVGKNIVFCFTNARSTFYRPGDTFPALQVLLKENKNTVIPLGKDNVFCLDNEAFRFLCALRENIKFDENDKKNFSASWEKSVAETSRMIDFISGLQPHSLAQTLSLNETRKIIDILTKPIVDIANNIESNIVILGEKEMEMTNCRAGMAELEKKMYIPAVDLVKKYLPHHRTVCCGPNCRKPYALPNSGMTVYRHIKHCHERCFLPQHSAVIGDPNLQRCLALIGNPDKCRICGCSWKIHMHITYDFEEKMTKIRNTAIEQALQSCASDAEKVSKFMVELNRRTKELKDEQRIIMDASVKFGWYLKTNAIAPYNDATADYLDMLIETKKASVSSGCDKKTIVGLQQMMAMYTKEKEIFENVMKSEVGANLLGPLEIKNIVQNLYALKVNGSKLKEIVETAQSGIKRMITCNETVFRPVNNK